MSPTAAAPSASLDGNNTHVGPSTPPDLERYVTEDAPLYKSKAAAIPKQPGDQQGYITVQPLKKSEMQASYAQDLGTENVEHGLYGSIMHGLGGFCGVLGAIPCCPVPNPYRNVAQGNVGLISRFGQFYKAVDPGLTNVNICSESIQTVNVRISLDQIPKQTVLTRDNVNVHIDSVICWHIVSPYRAVFAVNDVRSTLIERAQTTLRNVVGSRTLQNLVTEREHIAVEIAEVISGPAEKWGVAVESILIKDITFSQSLQESLSSAAQAKRVGESKVIAARAEVDAAKLMREAADILSSPAAMSIRTLDALQNMAKTANSKVVFVPMNTSNMGQLNPGQGAPPFEMGNSSNFKQIAEQAGESDLPVVGGSAVGQAAYYNNVEQI